MTLCHLPNTLCIGNCTGRRKDERGTQCLHPGARRPVPACRHCATLSSPQSCDTLQICVFSHQLQVNGAILILISCNNFFKFLMSPLVCTCDGCLVPNNLLSTQGSKASFRSLLSITRSVLVYYCLVFVFVSLGVDLHTLFI